MTAISSDVNSEQTAPRRQGEMLLRVDNLCTYFHTPAGLARAVDGISFVIRRGETFALVGESGCGKSVTALSIMQLVPQPAGQIVEGRILLEEKDLVTLSAVEKRKVRGNEISMIFQNPMTSLNPVMRIGRQIDEVVRLHQGLAKEEAKQVTIDTLRRVHLPAPERQYRSYPHQLSGGMLQRVMIAMALACKPKLLIADEPTTALDVTVQDQILALMQELQAELGMSILLITHDLGVVAEMAEEVGVMYAGHLVERANVRTLLGAPKHPYTQRLLESLPSRAKAGERLRVIPGQVPAATAYGEGCRFATRCHQEMTCCQTTLPDLETVGDAHRAACLLYDSEYQDQPKVKKDAGETILTERAASPDRHPQAQEEMLLQIRDFKVHFPIHRGVLQSVVGHVRAVDGVNLAIPAGRTFALVGESGCGKTTFGKGLLRLVPVHSGSAVYQGVDIASLPPTQFRSLRRNLQMIFQNPYGTLDPRMMIYETIGEGLRAQGLARSYGDMCQKARELLSAVGLDPGMIHRYPHEFSGGQLQRIGIARALAVDPTFIVCDEVTSALDVSVQAQILNLLSDLQRERGLSYLFITHDLSVVRHIADRVGVMYLGNIVEEAACRELFARPLHPYTQALLSAIPEPDPARQRERKLLTGDVPRADAPPPGCRFHPRCPHAREQCRCGEIPVFAPAPGRRVKCLLHEGK